MAKLKWTKPTQTETDVAPCFNCGNEEGLMLYATNLSADEKTPIVRQMVLCPKCGTTGPACEITEKAFVTWNALANVWEDQGVSFPPPVPVGPANPNQEDALAPEQKLNN